MWISSLFLSRKKYITKVIVKEGKCSKGARYKTAMCHKSIITLYSNNKREGDRSRPNAPLAVLLTFPSILKTTTRVQLDWTTDDKSLRGLFRWPAVLTPSPGGKELTQERPFSAL